MTEPHAHRVGVESAVATITLDRPAAYNAVTRALIQSLLRTLTDLERDPAVRAIVLTGAGKGFCAGQALDDVETIPAHGMPDYYRVVVDGFNPVILKLITMEKPIVAAVNGVAAGAGFGLALACDFRIVAETATFTTAFVRIGLVPDSGVSVLLPRIIGYAKALELCMLSEKIDARAADKLGLVTRLVPFADVLGEAQRFAHTLASGPRSLGLIKRQLVRNALGDVTRCLTYEAEMQSIAGETSDAREGIAAFGSKRAPVFNGN